MHSMHILVSGGLRMNRQRRFMEVRDIGNDGRTFTARAVNYNVVDWYETEFAPGCFTESLVRGLPKLAWGHDWKDIIGRVIDYGDSPVGLDLRCRLSDPEAVPRAKQAMAQLRDGDVTDVSVGFGVGENGYEMKDGIQRFTRCDLDELSLVLAGAVPGAKVLALRSKGKRAQFYVTEDSATQILSAFAEATSSGVPQSQALIAALSDLQAQAIDLDAAGEKKDEPKPEGKPDEKPAETEKPETEPEVGDPVEIETTPDNSEQIGADLDELLGEADSVLDSLIA